MPEIFVKNEKNDRFIVSAEAKTLVNEMNAHIRDKNFEIFHSAVNNIKKGGFPKTFDNIPEDPQIQMEVHE